MRRTTGRWLPGFLAAGLLAACAGGDEPVVCTALYAYGLTVEVVDSASGAHLLDGVTVTDEDGAFHETLQGWPGGGSWVGAGERAGAYTVRVTAPGYVPWTRSAIQVERDTCHVHGVHLLARLQPQ